MDWTEVIVTVSADEVDSASDIAQMVVPYGIYIEDYRTLEEDAWEIAHIDLIDEDLLAKDRSKALIHIYIAPEENPTEAVAFLSERYNAQGIIHTISTVICRNEDWENNWKQYFKPIEVGERLLIRPTWEENYDPGERKVLNIEPGLAFGTGTHETTRLCLESLEKYITMDTTVLDIGCGSGILSIASLLLGAKSATGVDVDKLAVKTAIDNGKVNGFTSPEYEILNGNLTDKVSGQFDVIVANIVADIIIDFCEDVAKFMKPNAVFITSGIIDIRKGDVLDAFNKHNFIVISEREENGWVCLVCKSK